MCQYMTDSVEKRWSYGITVERQIKEFPGEIDSIRVAGKQGFEPRLHEPESCVL